MDVDRLRSFVEVYNCRSITKAAENLYVSQPALSRRIQALEEELKITLFIRSGACLEPSDGGKMLYKEAIKIIRQHDSAVVKMKQFKSGVGGALRIGVLNSIRLSPTMRAVSLMNEKYPDIELSFDCDKNTNVTYRLTERDIDVGITVYGEVCGFDGLHYEVLSENTLAVLIGRNHRLWKKRPLYLEDLNGEVLYYIEGTARQSAEAVAQYNKEQKIIFSDKIPCRSLEEQMLYLAEGKGIAFSGVISNELNSSMRDLVDLVPVERTALKQGFTVAVYDTENQLAQKFVEILKQTW